MGLDLTEGARERAPDNPEPRSVLRSKIRDAVGDPESLIGTLADFSGFLLVHLLADVIATSEAAVAGDTNAQRKMGLIDQLAQGHDVAAMASTLHASLVSGDSKIPANVKGFQAVVEEVMTRATATADILSSAQEA